MTDDVHRPTYTSPDVHGAYNATQVRLYGVPGPSYTPPPTKKPAHGKGPHGDADKVNVLTGYLPDDDFAFAFMEGRQTTGDNSASILAGIKKGFGDKSVLVRSSFVFINSVMAKYMIMLGAIDVGGDEDQKLSAGIIFGYAYEGHCYDLPKPKIMLIPALPRDVPADDCGYDLKAKEGYKVWIVDKLDQCIELEVNQGFVEQLVLEANLPGKRSPTMYAGRQMLGHRSGRLME
jgi:hypothetical protein